MPMLADPLALARHGETVFNARRRMQGMAAHTPLSRNGLAQAEAMGHALAAHLGSARLEVEEIWSSPAGRALQTAAIMCEILGQDYFAVRVDPLLGEIDVGAWTGRDYADIMAEAGPILCPERRLFSARPPGGEWYPQVRQRALAWLGARASEPPLGGARLVVSHGLTSRVLRGCLGEHPDYDGVPVAADAPQGSLHWIEGGRERLLHEGSGHGATGAA